MSASELTVPNNSDVFAGTMFSLSSPQNYGVSNFISSFTSQTLSPAALMSTIYYYNGTSAVTLTMPSGASLVSYVQSNIISPIPTGFNFNFRIVNGPTSGLVTFSSNSDAKYDVRSTTATDQSVPAGADKEFVFLFNGVNGAGMISVIG